LALAPYSSTMRLAANLPKELRLALQEFQMNPLEVRIEMPPEQHPNRQNWITTERQKQQRLERNRPNKSPVARM
jgi:hypothetical protein